MQGTKLSIIKSSENNSFTDSTIHLFHHNISSQNLKLMLTFNQGLISAYSVDPGQSSLT